MLSFSGVTFILFCFCFRLFSFTEAAALCSIVFRYACAPTATCSYLTIVYVLFLFSFLPFLFVYLDMSLLPSVFVPLPFSLCMESTTYVFPLRMLFFYLVATGWIFYISLCDKSINQSIVGLLVIADPIV